MVSSRLTAGSPAVAQGWELEVIAAVIIGGTSLSGGVGTIWGTLIGVLFIGAISNAMTFMKVHPYPQYVVQGALILVAVLINRLQRTKAE
jgi:ribose/xylose/arabinose/galactoside ABC-type transport system permease subunit